MDGKALGQKPAFPQAKTIEALAYHEDADPGLTLREIYAGFSLMGIRASGVEFDARLAARMAVVDAEALCDELAKGGDQ